MARRSKNSDANSVAMVPGKNGGQLLAGGKPGNAGGPGRPPSAIREIARRSFAKRIPILERIADSDESKDSDRIAAVKVLADTGGVDKLALTVEEQPEREWTPERLAEAWKHLQAVRSIQQLERMLIGNGKPGTADAGD